MHGQEQTPIGKLMFRYGLIIDMFLLHDQPASQRQLLITNAASMDVVCRDLYGIIKAFADVGPGGDPHRKKTKFRARDFYDVAALWEFDPMCPAADNAVTKSVRDSSAITRALGAGGD